MKYDPQKHHRRSIRLRGFDYAQTGAYFVTIVTLGRECLLGEIVDGEMRLNVNGEIVCACWDDLPSHYANVELDKPLREITVMGYLKSYGRSNHFRRNG